MAVREWGTKFFLDEKMTVDFSAVDIDGLTDWVGKGKVLWLRGETKNELNPRHNPGLLRQPEAVGKEWDAKDNMQWSLFIPSIILTKAQATPPLDPIPLTLLQGAGDEDLAYGLRFYFERAGTGALLCLSNRERGNPGGRWNQGISQKTIEGIFKAASLKGKPEVQVIAGYSTGYAMVQTINNELVPLASVKRLIFFDCIYRVDKPPLPPKEPAPLLRLGDLPEFANLPQGKGIRDEGGEKFKERPFNMRRAISRLTAASQKCVIAAYSTTSGGSPRYTIIDEASGARLQIGKRPVVEIPNVAELRDAAAASGSSWSPTLAYDVLILSRYLDLGVKAGIIAATAPPQYFQDIISNKRIPERGTVFSSNKIKPFITIPTGVSPTIDLLTWANALPAKPTNADISQASRLMLKHFLILPEWNYDERDLGEYRHAGCLMEFAWELLPP